MNYIYKNESGAVGPIVLFAVGLSALTLAYMFISPMFDSMFNVYNEIQTSTGYMTQASADTVDIVRLAITYFPVLIVIVLVLALLIAAIKDRDDEL